MILQCTFLIPMLLIIMIIPETPRWLVAHNRSDEALAVLQRLNRKKMSDEAIAATHSDITNTVAYEASIGAGQWRDLLKNDEIQSLRRLLIACSIQAFQQLGGINALIYYSNTLSVFLKTYASGMQADTTSPRFSKSLGFGENLSALMSGFLNTW